MTEVLSQEEIDQLLAAVNEDNNIFRYPIGTISQLAQRFLKGKTRSSSFVENKFVQSIDSFQSSHYHVDASNINQVYNDVTLMEPQAIFKIGSVEFIPVLMCPHCKKFHFREDIERSYETDVPTPEFACKNRSLSPFKLNRKWLTDNRTVRCSLCGKRYQPTIIIKNTLENVPYFCRMQLIDALDRWFLNIRNSRIQLFSTQTDTVRFKKNQTTLYWDVFLSDIVNGLSSCPHTLLVNIIKYTPSKDLERMVKREKGIAVFEKYNFYQYYKSTHIYQEI